GDPSMAHYPYTTLYRSSGTEVLRALAAGFGSDPEAGQNQAVRVVWDLRLPRIAAALLVGAALSTAGAAYQTMFRNPLVSPDILRSEEHTSELQSRENLV